MADDWTSVRVEHVAERVAMGPFGSSIKVETFVSEGVPVISGQHLHGFRLDEGPGFNFITPEHAERLRNANVRRGDVVITHRGTIGQIAYIPVDSVYERYVISQSQFCLRPDPNKVLPEFVVAYFRSAEGRHKLLANASQVGVPSIAQPVTYLRSLEIPLPPLPEQRAIAHILGTLDDKIELNRRMSETLEAIARALFKSWFVDFDPVRAKMQGRDPGLPKDIADLFPDRLVESELGEIPEGWDDCPLSEVLSERGERVGDAEVPEYSSTNNGLQLRSERFKKQLSASSTKNKLICKGDLVFGLSRRVLNFGLMRDEIGSVSPVYRVFAVRSEVVEPDLVERVMRLRSKYYYNAVSASSREGQSVSPEALGLLRFVVPSKAAQRAFYRFAETLHARAAACRAQSAALAHVRDTLLPKLITGELRVGDPTRFIGAAE